MLKSLGCTTLIVVCACSAKLDATGDAVIRCVEDADCPGGAQCLSTGWCAGANSVCVTLVNGVLSPAADGGACTLTSGGAGVCSSGVCTNCGDGMQVGPEQCDDGNTNNNDGCLNTCKLNVCGDGAVNTGVEACDDGNTSNNDTCLVGCVANVCGDGFVNPAAETCDDGANTNPNDGCFDCAVPTWTPQVVVGTGPAPDQLANQRLVVSAMAGDAAGNQYFYSFGQVWRWDAATHALTLYAGTGLAPADTVIPEDEPARFAALQDLSAIAVDNNGLLYMGERAKLFIYRVTGTGTLERIAGTGSSCAGTAATCGIGGLARDYSFNTFIIGIKFDAAGNMYVRDWAHIYRVDSRSGVITLVAGNGTTCSDAVCGDGGAATSAALQNDGEIAIDSVGNVFFSEENSAPGGRRIRRIDAVTGIVNAFAGSNGSTACTGVCGDGGPPSAARFNELGGMVFDANDALLVADGGLHRVRRLTATTVDTIVGSGTVCASFSSTCGDGGAPLAANLVGPNSVTVDVSGNIDVLDVGNTVRVRQVSGSAITTIIGDGLPPDTVPETALGTSVSIGVGPFDIEPNGDIDVVVGTRVFRLRHDTGALEHIAGVFNESCPSPYTGACGDGGPATQATFSALNDIRVTTDGAIWLADNTRVRVIRNGTVSTIAGTGAACTTASACNAATPTTASFGRILAIAVNATDDIVYVFDSDFNVVRKVQLPNGPVTTFAGTDAGTITHNGDSGAATGLNLACPTDIAVDDAGALYIADFGDCRVLKVDASGTASLFAPASVPSCDVDTGIEEPCANPNATGFAPVSISWDSTDLLVVPYAGTPLSRLTTTSLTTVAQTSGTTTNLQGDGGLAANAVSGIGSMVAARSGPSGIVFSDSSTPVEVSAHDPSLRNIASDSTLTSLIANVDAGPMGPFAVALLARPNAFAMLPSQRLAIADGARLRLIDITGQTVTTVAGYSSGFPITTTAQPARYVALADIRGLAYDSVSSRLFVSDDTAHAIYEINAATATWTIRRIVGGVQGYADGPGDAAQLSSPQGLAIDATTRQLWIADFDNQALRTVAIDDPQYTVATPVGQPLHPGFAGDNGPAASARLDSPSAIAINDQGRLCFTDTFNNRVRCVDTSGVINTLADATDGLIEPRGVTFDTYGNVLIASQSHVFSRAATNDATPSTGTPFVTIYGGQQAYPASTMHCMSGVIAVGDNIWVSDNCEGLVVPLTRTATP